MNTFCVAAQDIAWIEFAWLSDDEVVSFNKHEGMPETYLKGLDETLSDWGRRVSDADRLFVVTGPGSFTASRVSVTIVNTLGFVHDLAVGGAKNPEHTPLKKFLEDCSMEEVSFRSGKTGFVTPVYDRPPGITQPKSS